MRLHSRGRTLYRDTENGMFLGVCAGMADYLGLDVLLLRAAALLGLFVVTVPAAIAYVIAAVLLRDHPLQYRGTVDERGFWSSRRGGY